MYSQALSSRKAIYHIAVSLLPQSSIASAYLQQIIFSVHHSPGCLYRISSITVPSFSAVLAGRICAYRYSSINDQTSKSSSDRSQSLIIVSLVSERCACASTLSARELCIQSSQRRSLSAKKKKQVKQERNKNKLIEKANTRTTTNEVTGGSFVGRTLIGVIAHKRYTSRTSGIVAHMRIEQPNNRIGTSSAPM